MLVDGRRHCLILRTAMYEQSRIRLGWVGVMGEKDFVLVMLGRLYGNLMRRPHDRLLQN